MKVLLINNCHYKRGGADIVYLNTARLLEEHGHHVVFFSFADNKNLNFDAKNEYFVRKSGKIKQLLGYFHNKEAARELAKVLEKEKPDIAHAHLMWGGMTGAIIPVLHKYGVPIVHTVHDYRMVCPAYTFRNGKGEVCERCKGGRYMACIKNRCSKGSLIVSSVMAAEMLYRNRKWHPAKELDGIIYVSKFAKEIHEEMDPHFASVRNIVLYNFTSLPQEPIAKQNETKKYYLYYGRLSYEKGVSTLVKAFARHPETELKVVGTGPMEKELKSHDYKNVEFLGYKSGDELISLVRNARYVCVPSEWYENNPMTIVEAYAMGVPVIGARIGGIPEIVIDGVTGYLFESGHSESLERVIQKTLQEGSRDYIIHKKAAMAFAQEYFNSGLHFQRLLCFYTEIMNEYKEKK